MKRLTSIGCFAVIVALTTTFAAGTAVAAPRSDGPVSYSASRVGQSVKLAVRDGSITTTGDSLSLRAANGAERLRIPLTFTLNGTPQRLGTTVSASSTTATLTPIVTTGARKPAASKPTASNQDRFNSAPRTKEERDRVALAVFNEQVRAALTISTIVGTILGGIVGGVAGCILGLPLFGVGCIPGFVGGVGLGSALGAIGGGGGGLIGFGIQYWNTINSPFKPPTTAQRGR